VVVSRAVQWPLESRAVQGGELLKMAEAGVLVVEEISPANWR
jgi:hypothetical protein